MSSKKRSIKKFMLNYRVGFVVYCVVAGLIFFLCSSSMPVTCIVNMVWTFAWAVAFADYIANAAVDEYKESKRREEFPTTNDLNEDVDKIISTGDKGEFTTKKYVVKNPEKLITADLKGAHLGTRYCKHLY